MEILMQNLSFMGLIDSKSTHYGNVLIMLTKDELKFYLDALPVVNTDSYGDLYTAEIDDLYFLYCLVREKVIISIMEFGSGWSTSVLSLALYENFVEYGDRHLAQVRHPNPFRLLTIDASAEYMEIALGRIPITQREKIDVIVSTPQLIDLGGFICHQFPDVPNFSPDLIYLDGPDHDQVKGEIRGFKYLKSFTQPMGADILALEPFLWPETIIVTDGRTANARFLESRLQREWQSLHDPFGDRTIFRLNETALGLISENHINFRLIHSRFSNSKEIPHGQMSTES